MMRRRSLLLTMGISALVATLVVVGLASASSLGVDSRTLTARTTAISVPKSTPTLTQSASAGGMSSLTNLTDQVTMTDGTSNATGTLTFRLHSDASCAVQYGASSVIAVSGATGAAYTSAAITPLPKGTYYWTVTYSGDANNHPVSTSCGAANSTAVITDGPMGYVAIGPSVSATSNATVTVPYPSGTATNDLLFLVEINAFGTATVSPSGWTLLASPTISGPERLSMKVWTRLSGGGTSVDLSIRTGAPGSTAWVVRYTRSSGYPPDPATATSTVRSGVSAAAATLTPSPDLTTDQPWSTVISFAAVRAANSLSLGTPRSFLLRTATTSTPAGGSGVALAVADLLQGTAGTSSSPTWSQSGTSAVWAWTTVAFH